MALSPIKNPTEIVLSKTEYTVSDADKELTNQADSQTEVEQPKRRGRKPKSDDSE